MSGSMPISPWKMITPAVTTGIGASSQSTTAAPAGCHAALIAATGDCHIRISATSGTAVNTDTLIRSAYPPLVFGVSPGDVVSVIQDAAATGSVYVTWLTH